MSNTTNNEMLSTMFERRSVKKYKKNVTIPKEVIHKILSAGMAAPSSWNLQHWKFLVVDQEDLKYELCKIAYNQRQVIDSSITIAILGDLEAFQNVFMYDQAVQAGKMTETIRNSLVAQIDSAYQHAQLARDEAIRNASLAAMNIMLAAKSLGYDTCPMGGYDEKRFVQQFRVPSRYLPVMLICVGVAAESPRSSARLPLADMIVSNSF